MGKCVVRLKCRFIVQDQEHFIFLILVQSFHCLLQKPALFTNLHTRQYDIVRGLVKTICRYHNVIVTLSVNPSPSPHSVNIIWITCRAPGNPVHQWAVILNLSAGEQIVPPATLLFGSRAGLLGTLLTCGLSYCILCQSADCTPGYVRPWAIHIQQ